MRQQKTINRFLALVMLIGLSAMIYGDGLIVVNPHHPHPIPPRPNFNPFLLEVKYHKVNVEIEDHVALTSIDQVFYNPTGTRLEGYYIFPIPENAVIKKFSMFINDKETEAEMLDATKARQIYEDIVRRQMDPALLEYMGRGIFKVRIFPIEPYSEKRVKISYREMLSKDNRTIEYLYPLNTEKFSAKPIKDVSIHVRVKSGESIKNIYCPTHNVEIVRKGNNQAVIGFEEKNTKPDTDFKLYFSTDNSQLGFSLMSYKKDSEDGYFFLSISPGFNSGKDEIVPKDIAFVLDVSGSMAGKKLDQAKKALLFCIENLNKGDRFEIIRFSTEAEALFNGYKDINETNRTQARDFVSRLKPIGGTNIDEALTMALKMNSHGQRPSMIIFLTDGKPTVGETDENSLLNKIKSANGSKTRIFTFGIGNELNTHLLDKITELTRAYRSYISEEEDIEVKVSNFYSNVQSPILTDIQLDFGQGIRVSKIYPSPLPDLFKGSSLTILGRYDRGGKTTITLRGKVENKEKEFKFDTGNGFISQGSTDSMRNEFVAPLWAARRVGFLLDQIRLHGQEKELIDEVTQLARTYGIITPYTSYLILEDERDNMRRNVIRREDQTLTNVAAPDAAFEKKTEAEYTGMKSKSGYGSVQASKDFQQLNTAQNYAQTKTGQSRMKFMDKGGVSQDMDAQVKNIQGRAFYNAGNNWIDSHIQSKQYRNQKVNRIQFASPEYFKLIEKEPQVNQFLSLGKNVRFAWKNNVYEVYE